MENRKLVRISPQNLAEEQKTEVMTTSTGKMCRSRAGL